jgi:hypothetical protein
VAKKTHPAVRKAQDLHKQLGEALQQIAQMQQSQQQQPQEPEPPPGPMPGGTSPLGGMAK